MKRYLITISAVVEVENEEEAVEVADDIVNAELGDDVEQQIESLHYHNGYGAPEISEL